MKELSAILTKDPDFIHDLMAEIKQQFKWLMPFGASNLNSFNEIYFALDEKDIKKLHFPPSLSLFERAKLIARHELSYLSEPPHVEVFIKGTGGCSHLNFFALMVLAKKYNFVARLENIHSDETHTYVVLSDAHHKEYILDIWSESALAYDNSLEWNEVMPAQYSRKAGATVSVDSYWTASYLRTLWSQLETSTVLEQKRSYYDSVMFRAIKSRGPGFFPPPSNMNQEQTVPMNITRGTAPAG
ncbi:hypothetical protein [Legionella sp. km772]|uniref:hypothetical protein n=1 Tax=Legionella sp. km772 TaxID=2498111 RepID=UPI000F8F06A8|nr:hypothetical protein [Legionella sp. km772]RUR11130.1 hypothetical protein ELY15_07400 [Legionella sp. km772]